MTIYIEENQYAAEIKRQMVKLASSKAGSPTPAFLAGVQLSNAYSVDVNNFSKVIYSRAAAFEDNDLGTYMLDELANHQTVIYVHGVDGSFAVASQKPIPGRNIDPARMKTVSEQGGGSTTKVYSDPNVDVFLDGTPNNTNYRIAIVPDNGIKTANGVPYIRMYHEFVHAAGSIFNCTHSHWSSIPQTNRFRDQRNIGHHRQLSTSDSIQNYFRAR